MEGDGAECAECGNFDLLVFTCGRCGGQFCREHTNEHRTLAAGRPPCVAVEATVATTTTAEEKEEARGGEKSVKCVVCGSTRCVLKPCAGCRQPYCAEHRFHDCHRPLAPAGSGTAGARANPTAGAAVGQRHAKEAGASPLRVLCNTHDKKHPLVLTPPSHKGRQADLTLLVLAGTAPVEVCVCSCRVPCDGVAGQWVLRAAEALVRAAWPALAASAVPEAARRCVLYALSGAASGNGESVPGLAWAPVALSTAGKDVLAIAAQLTLSLCDPEAEPADEAARTEAVQQLLFPLSGADVSARYGALAKDLRVKSIAAHLRLQSQRLTAASGAS